MKFDKKKGLWIIQPKLKDICFTCGIDYIYLKSGKKGVL